MAALPGTPDQVETGAVLYEELVTWVIERAASWVSQARASAKSERQQRLVNAVHDAGLCLGAMRALDRQFNQVLVDIRSLNPAELHAEKRHSIANELHSFVEVPHILPIIGQAESSLEVFARGAPDELRDDLRLIAQTARDWGPSIGLWEYHLLPIINSLHSSSGADGVADAAEALQKQIRETSDVLREADRAFGRLRAELLVAVPLAPPPAWVGEMPPVGAPSA